MGGEAYSSNYVVGCMKSIPILRNPEKSYCKFFGLLGSKES